MSSDADGPSAGTAPAVPAPAGRRRVLMTVATVLATAAPGRVLPAARRPERCSASSATCSPAARWSRRCTAAPWCSTGSPRSSELTVGDVITYVPPGMSSPLSHRIMSITPGDDGELVFTTRGDANDAVDPWLFTLDDPGQARVSFASRMPATRCGCSAAGCPGSC